MPVGSAGDELPAGPADTSNGSKKVSRKRRKENVDKQKSNFIMEDYRGKDREKEEVYSKAVKAGKRTYFMDVKETKSGDLYLTITESKRIFDENLNKFIYDKHKIFLYKEDFENFVTGLQQTIRFIETGELPPEEPDQPRDNGMPQDDMDFENLGN